VGNSVQKKKKRKKINKGREIQVG
jgi:DNA relaxase NicK